MTIPGSVTVIGASAAGLSTVEALRRNGYRDSIGVVGWSMPKQSRLHRQEVVDSQSAHSTRSFA